MNRGRNIESQIGLKLPPDYIDFLNTVDKEKYNYKKYLIPLDNGMNTSWQIDRFSEYETFLEDNKYRSFIEEFQIDFQLPKSFVESEYLYIIAMCDSNCICLSMDGIHKGKIYNVDNGDFGIRFLSNTLNDFLSKL